ncbi:MAG: ABC transporter permease DevC [Gemmataceae bacterium]|nr:ABC transporter permease DevC [Gemmataceae bacterium]MDW8264767.1 ABC transporter permease DevC [Gemmataceae bacterium]
MRVPLAWSNLMHQKARTAIAVAGVAFAVVLIFMQLGFYGSVEATATLVYDQLEFDIILVSSEYLHIQEPGSFPQVRLAQASAVPGVARVAPVYIGFNRWRNPDDPADHPYGRKRRHLLVLGIRPTDRTFRLAEVQAQRWRLREPNVVLMDRRSRFEFFGEGLQTGDQTEVGVTRISIGGWFSLGGGFGGDGTIIVGDDTFSRLFGNRSLDRVTLGLVQTHDHDPDQVRQVACQLGEVLPDDVAILTRDQLRRWETHHWVHNTSVGIIFGLGLVIALSVGIIFVYQVVSSDISSHLPEYATLKAIGYDQPYLVGVILRQSLLLALLGYLPGLAAALGLYALTRRSANLPIEMNLGRMVLVFVLAVAMCGVSGVLSVQKLRVADPADLFR